MKFAGYLKLSTVDYPKKMVATAFTGACNYRCEYCHNGDLIEIDKKDINVSEDEIISHLIKRRNVLDGICITGGEPSLWGEELISFIRRLRKELGDNFLIKVDTNGSNYDFLNGIKDLIDFVAMDFKSLDYSKFSSMTLDEVKKSIRILKEFKNHELRITMYPEYIKEKDFQEIASIVKLVDRVAIQQYNPKKTYIKRDIDIYPIEVLENFKMILAKTGADVVLRT